MDKTEKYIYHRGDIVYVNDLPATGGHELCGNRPAVIISSNHLNRYDLYGTHTVTGDGIKDKTLTFKEDGTASGYIGKDFGEANGVHWSVSMDEGILHINFTGSKDAIQYVFSYDDDMNIVLTGEKETLTLTKR